MKCVKSRPLMLARGLEVTKIDQPVTLCSLPHNIIITHIHPTSDLFLILLEKPTYINPRKLRIFENPELISHFDGGMQPTILTFLSFSPTKKWIISASYAQVRSLETPQEKLIHLLGTVEENIPKLSEFFGCTPQSGYRARDTLNAGDTLLRIVVLGHCVSKLKYVCTMN